MNEVSRALGNTPAVCRSSCVDQQLVEAYRDERTIAAALKRAARVDGPAVLQEACAPLLSRA
jgi:DNA topoisomerase-1